MYFSNSSEVAPGRKKKTEVVLDGLKFILSVKAAYFFEAGMTSHFPETRSFAL